MGIADSFRQLAEKAKARMAASEDGTTVNNDDAMLDEKYDNAAGDRFGSPADRGQEIVNERTDDFSGDRRNMRNNRDLPGA